MTATFTVFKTIGSNQFFLGKPNMENNNKQPPSDLVQALLGLRSLDRLIARLELLVLCVLVLGLVTAELWAIFVTSHTWLKNLFKYSVVWIGLIGASLATQTGEHISIAIIQPAKTRTHRAIRLLVNSLSALVTLVLAISALDYINYDQLRIDSGKGTANDLAIGKLYLPKNQMATLQRDAAGLDEKTLAGCKLLVYQSHEREWEEMQSDLSKIGNHLEQRRKTEAELEQLKQEWLQQHWQTWQQRLSQAWTSEGEAAWRLAQQQELKGDDLKWFRMKWQEDWMARSWQSQWQAVADAAWQSDGKATLAIGADEAESKKAWQTRWIQQQWLGDWRDAWLIAWQTEGRKAYFQKQWSARWLQRLWQQEGRLDWAATARVANTMYQPKDAEHYLESSWQIPRWLLLAIIPIALFIMAFRFALRALYDLFLPNTPFWEEFPSL